MLPPVCSRDPTASNAPTSVCQVAALPGSTTGKRVQINLKATTAPIQVGGYTVSTENYNASYLSPIVEALPGDTVAASLQNTLEPRQPSATPAGGHAHHGTGNPTNLHFFHGGIVTPRNSRTPNDPTDQAATQGNGDNVYTYLQRGSSPFLYEVPIPNRLDARVIDGNGVIPHPNGLNWYHSHLHGYSSDQVMGGLSGLLSVGDAKANLVACRQDPADQSKCNDDPAGTVALKARTDVRYALLRDISLKEISALPEAGATTPKTAIWAPELKDWQQRDCKVWRTEQDPGDPNPKLRKGYCQQDDKKAWLFTVNGQRFPTVTVEGGRNLLLRLGNLSANVVYWLELANEQDDADRAPLLLLGIDGVVPAKPVTADPNRQPVKATPVNDLVFMPASRAEILIRNDCTRPQAKNYILRTKGVVAGNDGPLADRWPEIQLMRIVLQPSTVSCTDEIALNAVAGRLEISAAAIRRDRERIVTRPEGCVDDVDPANAEHRKVTFFDTGFTSDGRETRWSILTEILKPPGGATSPAVPYGQFIADPAKTVGMKQPDGSFFPIPFEEYDLGDGKVDWQNKKANGEPANRPHTCILVDPTNPAQRNGLQQLWVLENLTGDLHNFHIHQMKFRLATAEELANRFKIKMDGEPSQVCADPPACKTPVHKLYDAAPPNENTRWHDTIPMPPNNKVFVIMSFVAEEQVGRYVYHCHILKHEDSGLMAPIEVWKPM